MHDRLNPPSGGVLVNLIAPPDRILELLGQSKAGFPGI
jgi:hypothetical protein